MNKLVRFAVAGATIGGMILPLAVSAASFTNLSFDGETTVTGTPGEVVEATFRVVVPPGQRVRFIETDVNPGLPAPVCHEVDLSEGTHFVDLDIKLPTITGSGYDISVDAVGRNDNQPVLDCDDTSSGVIHNPDSFNNVIRVIPGTTPPIGGGDDEEDAFLAKILAILKSLGLLKEEAASCSTYDLYASLSFGMRSASVKAYQMFLIGQGQSIPAGPTGYFGPQTQAAENAYLSVAKCN